MLRELQKLYKPCLITDLPVLDTSGAKRDSMARIKRDLGPLLAKVPEASNRKLILAVFFLANNHVEHAQKQLPKKEDANFHYVSGLVLRRLGDYALASYHFREIPGHPLLEKVTIELQKNTAVQPVLRNFPGLLKKDCFNPPALTGIIQQVCLGGHISLNELVCKVQALEMIQVIRYLAV